MAIPNIKSFKKIIRLKLLKPGKRPVRDNLVDFGHFLRLSNQISRGLYFSTTLNEQMGAKPLHELYRNGKVQMGFHILKQDLIEVWCFK